MAFNLPFGVRVAGNDPVDKDRYQVGTIAERDQLVTDGRAYDGLQVYVISEQIVFILKGSTNSDWEVFGNGAGAGTTDYVSNVEVVNNDLVFTGVGNAVNKSVALPIGATTPEEENFALGYFVEPNANGVGTISDPMSLLQARDAIRQYKVDNGSLPIGDTIVYLRGGKYDIDAEGLILEAQDSGTSESPITYKAYSNEQVTFNGGVDIPFSEVTTVPQSIQDRIIDVNAKTAVRQIDLADIGTTISEKGVYRLFSSGSNGRLVNGTVVPFSSPEGKLYIDGTRLKYSQYPKKGEGPDNDGFFRIASVVDKGWVRRDGDTTGKEGGTFTYSEEELDNIVVDGNAKVYGFYGVTYADTVSTIDTLDPATNTISLLEDSWYGINYENDNLEEVRFRIDNTLEFIRDENEIFVDQNTGILYFIPQLVLILILP